MGYSKFSVKKQLRRIGPSLASPVCMVRDDSTAILINRPRFNLYERDWKIPITKNIFNILLFEIKIFSIFVVHLYVFGLCPFMVERSHQSWNGHAYMMSICIVMVTRLFID